MRLEASLLAVAISFGPSIASEAAPPACFYYMQGNEVRRISLADLRETTVLTLPASVAPADVRAAHGTVAWVDRSGPAPALRSWDGATTKRIPLARHHSGNLEDGFRLQYDGHGEFTGLSFEWEDRYLQDLLLSPEGSRVAWNVNVVTDVSPGDSAIAHQRHVIDWAEIGGKGSRRALDQHFDVTGILADRLERRRLLRWSFVDPAWVFFTRFEAGQTHDQHQGLFRCSLISGVVKTLSASIDEVLALSDDERWVAHTPNDETCCAGCNYTNNQVLVRDLRTGKETVVFDEEGEFKNEEIEPGEEGRTCEDYSIIGASFSPDGRRLAISMRRRSSFYDSAAQFMTTVRDVASGVPSGFREGKCVLGWGDAHRVLLGECRGTGDDIDISGSVSVLDADDSTETALPLKDVRPLGPGDCPAPAQ